VRLLTSLRVISDTDSPHPHTHEADTPPQKPWRLDRSTSRGVAARGRQCIRRALQQSTRGRRSPRQRERRRSLRRRSSGRSRRPDTCSELIPRRSTNRRGRTRAKIQEREATRDSHQRPTAGIAQVEPRDPGHRHARSSGKAATPSAIGTGASVAATGQTRQRSGVLRPCASANGCDGSAAG
jgi:hypothetical protein